MTETLCVSMTRSVFQGAVSLSPSADLFIPTLWRALLEVPGESSLASESFQSNKTHSLAG